MRAYMSDGSERRTREIDADQLDKASAFQWGEMAVAEARRILADVEPTISRPALDDERRFVPGDHVFRAALAEALTAFVADEERS